MYFNINNFITRFIYYKLYKFCSWFFDQPLLKKIELKNWSAKHHVYVLQYYIYYSFVASIDKLFRIFQTFYYYIAMRNFIQNIFKFVYNI